MLREAYRQCWAVVVIGHLPAVGFCHRGLCCGSWAAGAKSSPRSTHECILLPHRSRSRSRVSPYTPDPAHTAVHCTLYTQPRTRSLAILPAVSQSCPQRQCLGRRAPRPSLLSRRLQKHHTWIRDVFCHHLRASQITIVGAMTPLNRALLAPC